MLVQEYGRIAHCAAIFGGARLLSSSMKLAKVLACLVRTSLLRQDARRAAIMCHRMTSNQETSDTADPRLGTGMN
jgi:hypothetical protein